MVQLELANYAFILANYAFILRYSRVFNRSRFCFLFRRLPFDCLVTEVGGMHTTRTGLTPTEPSSTRGVGGGGMDTPDPTLSPTQATQTCGEGAGGGEALRVPPFAYPGKLDDVTGGRHGHSGPCLTSLGPG